MRISMSGMSEDFFSDRHYEGAKINQGIFSGHYEGSKINQGDFSFAEKHYESEKINLGVFSKGTL